MCAAMRTRLRLTPWRWRQSDPSIVPSLHQEKHFEGELADYLAAHGWLYSRDDTGYDRELALFPDDLIGYLKETQPSEWAKLRDWHNGSTERQLLERICKVMDADGSLSA